MSTALADLLFWVVILIVLYVVIRFLQKRKSKAEDDQGQE